MIVCLCKSVSDHQIREAVDQGLSSFNAVQSELEVSTACGACRCEVERVVDKHINETLAQKQPALAKEISLVV